MSVCAACGEENPPRARFCLGCGESLQDGPTPETRRVVTVLFADLVDSTALGESLDAEALREITGRCFMLMRAAVERHGGTVEKFIGDATVAVFGALSTREDDAIRAVRAAVDMRADLDALALETSSRIKQRLRIRIGVNTGPVVVGASRAGGSFATGDAVNVAARLQQVASPGAILMGDLTRQLVGRRVDYAAMPPVVLKGKASRVGAWQVLRVVEERASLAEPQSPFVGRARQLAWLEAQFELACTASRARRVAVVAEPGMGKTRLTAEFRTRVGQRATVLSGRCLSYGDGAAYWPLREALLACTQLAGSEPAEEARRVLTTLVGSARDAAAVVARLAAVCGFEAEGLVPEDVPWAVWALLERLAHERPVVLVVDDLHWAGPALFDVLEWPGSAGRVLVLTLTRPELLDTRSAWGALQDDTLDLGPLDRDAVELLVLDREVAPDLRRRLVAAAGGNPLFAEQLASMAEDQALTEGEAREVGGKAAHSGRLTIPPTLSVLLAARLDLLTREERSALEHASVIGTVFYPEALESLLGDVAGGSVESALLSLERKNFVQHAESDLPRHPAYRFVHGLVRDAAYDGMTKAARAGAHSAFADWLATCAGQGAPDVLVGHHLEQAWRYRTELAKWDAQTELIGRRAARHLTTAGRRLELSDVATSSALVHRAVSVLPVGDRDRVENLLVLGWLLHESGRLHESLQALRDALSESNGDPALSGRADLLTSYVIQTVEPTSPRAKPSMSFEVLVGLLERAQDDSALSEVCFIQSAVEGVAMRFDRCGELLDRAIRHGERAGDITRQARARSYLFTAHVFGSTPAERAIGTLDDLVRRHPEDLRLRAMVEQGTCLMHAFCGRFETARRIAAAARHDLEDLGQAVLAANLAQSTGPIEELSGDLVAADREYRESCAALAGLDENAYLSTVAGLHARMLARWGDVEAAWAACRLAGAHAPADDLFSLALVAEAEALLLAREGSSAESMSALRRSFDLTVGWEAPDSVGELHLSGALVAKLHGRPDLERQHLVRALALLGQKGNLVRAGQVEQRLRRLPR